MIGKGNKMKIGILTFHSAYNFGAVLQCFALFSTIKDMGYSVEVIDYRPDYLATKKETFHWYTFINRTPWRFYERVKAVINAKKFYHKFEVFNKRNLKLSDRCVSQKDLHNVCRRYDCVIIGSDQVWCNKFNGNDTSWFGFCSTTPIRWVGYAVSAGNTIYSEMQLCDLTRHFSAIGVRESELYQSMQGCYKGNLAHVLDPTLLAPTTLWEQWKNPIIDTPYILTYQARESDDVFRIARSLAQQLGVKLIVPIDFYPNVKSNGYNTKVCAPNEFVSLVKNARCVVTTSFHGTAFSVITGTPFYTLRLNDGADSRAESLLENLGLADRMVDASCDVIFRSYDTVKVHNLLNKLKYQSLGFLISSLQ